MFIEEYINLDRQNAKLADRCDSDVIFCTKRF